MDRQVLAKRGAVPATVVVAFAVLAVLRLVGQDALYDRILGAWGIIPFKFPFVDIHGVLSAIQCSAHGIDVYVTNPCDVLGRVFFYSPLLLWAAPTGIGIGATLTAGFAVDAAFVLSLFLLPTPRAVFARVWLFAAVLSTMTVFAVERANIDVLVFALSAVTGTLLLQSGRGRFVGYAAIVVATLIKFYPAVLFVLALREQPRTFARIALAVTAVLAAFGANYHMDIAHALANVPHGIWFTDMFGAVNLPYGLAALGIGMEPRLLWAALVGMAAVAALTLGASKTLATAQARLAPAESMFLAIGAALMVGCFFAGQSVGYRGVFLILTMPGLTALAQATTGRFRRAVFTAAPVVTVVLMWGEFFRHSILITPPRAAFAFWLSRELGWWFVMIVLGGVLVGFALSSETGRAAARLLPPRLLARAPLGLPDGRNPS